MVLLSDTLELTKPLLIICFPLWIGEGAWTIGTCPDLRLHSNSTTIDSRRSSSTDKRELLWRKRMDNDDTPKKAWLSMKASLGLECKCTSLNDGKSQKAALSTTSRLGQLSMYSSSTEEWTKSPVEIEVKGFPPMERIRSLFKDCNGIDGTLIRWLFSNDNSSRLLSPTKALSLIEVIRLSERISRRSPLREAKIPPERWEIQFLPKLRVWTLWKQRKVNN